MTAISGFSVCSYHLNNDCIWDHLLDKGMLLAGAAIAGASNATIDKIAKAEIPDTPFSKRFDIYLLQNCSDQKKKIQDLQASLGKEYTWIVDQEKCDNSVEKASYAIVFNNKRFQLCTKDQGHVCMAVYAQLRDQITKAAIAVGSHHTGYVWTQDHVNAAIAGASQFSNCGLQVIGEHVDVALIQKETESKAQIQAALSMFEKAEYTIYRTNENTSVNHMSESRYKAENYFFVVKIVTGFMAMIQSIFCSTIHYKIEAAKTDSKLAKSARGNVPITLTVNLESHPSRLSSLLSSISKLFWRCLGR